MIAVIEADAEDLCGTRNGRDDLYIAERQEIPNGCFLDDSFRGGHRGFTRCDEGNRIGIAEIFERKNSVFFQDSTARGTIFDKAYETHEFVYLPF